MCAGDKVIADPTTLLIYKACKIIDGSLHWLGLSSFIHKITLEQINKRKCHTINLIKDNQYVFSQIWFPKAKCVNKNQGQPCKCLLSHNEHKW